ncbi:MAG: 2-oxoacid:acceptor oxidoreductase family protein [Terriglobales bacterium]
MIEYEAIHEKASVFYDEFERKSDLKHQTHYCPGCGHGVTHKLVAEAIDELGLQNQTIFVSPVGCSVFAYYYFDTGNVQAAHGRAPAVATGLSRACPDKIVIAYQGDGDLAAIGTAEIVHAANRGEKIAVFFVNNAIYGMTGGQLAPTTLVGQTSTTTPWGRRASNEGFPLHICELLAQLEMPVYLERVALSDNKNIMKARKAIRKALEYQKQRAGFTLVEILSPCPTIWKKEPVKARKWVAEKMIPAFPLGVFRDRKPAIPETPQPPQRTVAEVLEIGQDKPDTLTAVDRAAAKHQTKPTNIKIAGFGGQGVLLLGQFITEMGMREGMEVSWLPSYGPEMRGGSAHCHVCLSHSRVGSPLVSVPDVLIAMNEISLRKFAPQVKPGGVILYNRSDAPQNFSAPQAKLICVPANEIADLLGSAKVANIVMLGALLQQTGCLPDTTAVGVLEDTVKNPALLEMNRKAIAAGADYIDKNKRLGAVSQPDGFAPIN